MTAPTEDWYLIAAILLRVAYGAWLHLNGLDPIFATLGDGYHTTKSIVDLFDPTNWVKTEEVQGVFMTAIEFPIIYWMARALVPPRNVRPFFTLPGWEFDFPLSNFLMVLMVLHLLRWSIPWWNTYTSIDRDGIVTIGDILRSAGLWVIVFIGGIVAVANYFAHHPDPMTIQYLFGDYIGLARDSVGSLQSDAGVRQIVTHISGLFTNNVHFLVWGVALGLIPVFGVVLAMTFMLRAAIVFGATVGLIIRNTMVASDSILTQLISPILAFLAATGIPPIWHAQHEFMPPIIGAVGAGILVLGLLQQNGNEIVAGLAVVLFAPFHQAFAAFVEGTFDAWAIGQLLGPITLGSDLVARNPNTEWVISVLSTAAWSVVWALTTGVVLLVTIEFMMRLGSILAGFIPGDNRALGGEA